MTKIIEAPTLDDALSALAEEIGRNEERGERTLVFCEDRLTLRAEQAVLSVRGGSFLTEVTTFRRFLSRASAAKTVSKQGSVLETAALIGELEGELTCFRRNAAQAVYETIAQLSASCVEPALLRSAAEETDGVLARKLSDLALLYERYLGFLSGRGLLDENGYLALLPDAMQRGLHGVNAVFFAFPSFTRQARQGIRAAIRTAASVTGIFLAGKADYYTGEAAGIFRRVAEEFGPAERILVPSSLANEALALSSALFSDSAERIRTGHVHVFRPTDEIEEMETVAALIRKYTAEGKRYRDLAVLVGGANSLLAVERAFKAYKIPYFADVKRKFSEHPFCVFTLAVLEGAADGMLPDEADAVASSVYFGGNGNYRNYLLRFGAFRGGVRREIRGEEEIGVSYGPRAELLACRERMRAILDLFKPKGSGKTFAEAVRKLWELVDGETVTAELGSRLPEEERAFLDISPLEGVLREAEEIVGGETFTAREFASLLKSGLEALTVSILPQRADAVFVGDVTESRIYRAGVLFCTGLTDALPRVSQDTAVITDGEIDRLMDLKVEIDPAISVVNARAREAFALNLCAFSEELYLSCPLRAEGKEAMRSEIFGDVERTFDMAPMPEIYPYDRCEFAPALLAFYRGADEIAAAPSAEKILRNSALRAVLMRDFDPETLRQTRQKTPEAGELFFGRDISPTLLEEYFACPYRGFAARALRLSDREDRRLLDMADAGTFVHTVLERTASKFNELESEEACRALARALAAELLSDPRYAAAGQTAAGSYTAERLVLESEAVAAAAYRQLVHSAYRVRSAEAVVRIPELSLWGKTDRIDEAGDFVRVIDYKTGSLDDSPTAYYTGRKLQLQLYLRAAAEGGMPAGAFYFPAADDFCGEGEEKFRMKGYWCNSPEAVAGFDTLCADGKSAFYESGSRDKGLPPQDFGDFLDYALLVAAGAEREMRSGNIAPSPYAGVCKYCKFKGMCGYAGEPREEDGVKCAEIAAIARGAKEGA